MDDYHILKQVVLGRHHVATGNSSHFLKNESLPPGTVAKIAKFDDDPGYYLLYFDADGNEMSDTYHDSVVGAMKQADFEFHIKWSDWQDVRLET